MKKDSPNNDTSNITKQFDADARAIQKIVFTGSLETKSVIYYIAEQSKETVLEFYKGATKVL